MYSYCLIILLSISPQLSLHYTSLFSNLTSFRKCVPFYEQILPIFGTFLCLVSSTCNFHSNFEISNQWLFYHASISLFVAFYRKKFWPAPLNGANNPLSNGPIETPKNKKCSFQGTTCKTGADTGASYFPEPFLHFKAEM